MTHIAAFGNANEPINPNWDLVDEVVEYNPYQRSRGQDEIIYRDITGQVHCTSTRCIRIFTLNEVLS